MRHALYCGVRLGVLACLAATLCIGISRGQGIRNSPNATVKADTLTVYSDMRVSSGSVVSLKKGDPVFVDFEFRSSAEKWCRVKLPSGAVRLGYVQCVGLDRKELDRKELDRKELDRKEEATAPYPRGSGVEAAPRTARDLPIASPSTQPKSGYEEMSKLVVREGSIDVVRLSQIDATARGGSAAAVRRGALAHCAAGDFELARNSNDEAIEQYELAVALAVKQPDLLVDGLMRLAYVHLHRSEYSAALASLDRARTVAPKSVTVARLSGWAYYGLDRLDEAVQQWKSAQQMEADPTIAILLENAERDTDVERGFRSGQTNHFTIHYEGTATPQLAGQILQSLEEDFRSIQAELRFAPQEPIAVVLYTQQNFRDVTRAPSWASARNDGRIRVPVQGLTSVSDELSRVLRHELAHSFIHQKTRNHCPQWLHEGLAQWLEGRRTGREAAQVLIAAYEKGAYPPLRNLEPSWDQFSSDQAGLAYAWALASVESIVANGGMWGIQRLLDTLGSGTAIGPALGTALQTNYANLERSTIEYLRRNYPKQAQGK